MVFIYFVDLVVVLQVAGLREGLDLTCVRPVEYVLGFLPRVVQTALRD